MIYGTGTVLASLPLVYVCPTKASPIECSPATRVLLLLLMAGHAHFVAVGQFASVPIGYVEEHGSLGQFTGSMDVKKGWR